LYAVASFYQHDFATAERLLTSRGGAASANGTAEGYYLLGRVLRARGSDRAAVQAFTKSLQIDSTLWCSFQEVCCEY